VARIEHDKENDVFYVVPSEAELQTEIEEAEELALLARAVMKMLKATDPDRAVIEAIATKYEQRKAEKEAKMAEQKKRKKP